MINGNENGCYQCYMNNDDSNAQNCLDKCLQDNTFIGITKDDRDPRVSWNIMEFIFDKYNEQYVLPSKLMSIFGVDGYAKNDEYYVKFILHL